MSDDDEDARLRALQATRLLDSPPERSFDRITRLAAALLKTPAAAVTLIDDHRQFLKSAVGIGEPWKSKRETPLSYSFCKIAVRQRKQLVVSDARTHPLVQDNDAVKELGIIAYAGIPLMVDKQAIGAFCVVDDKVREWTDTELELLDDLAESVVTEIEFRMALHAEQNQRALLNALIDGMGEGVIACDAIGKFVIANPAARRIFPNVKPGAGVVRGDGHIPHSLKLDGSPLTGEEGPLVRGIQGKSTNDLTFTVQKPDDKDAIWVEASGRTVRNEAGDVIAAVGVYRDVSEKMRENALTSTILRNIPRTAIAVYDHELRCLAFDGSIPRRNGASFADAVGKKMTDLAGMPEDHPAFAPILKLYREALAGNEGSAYFTFGERIMELVTAPVRDAVGRVTAGIVLAQDRTVERQLQENLERNENLLTTTLQHIDDGVVLLDENRAIVFANPAFSAIFGIPVEKLKGLPRDAFMEQLGRLMNEPPEALRKRVDVDKDTKEIVLVKPRKRILRRTEVPVMLQTGVAFLVTWHDITSEKQLLAERDRQATFDTLTGVLNRRGAEAALALEDSRRRRTRGTLSVAVFDVDHFKLVNDGHGHATGDSVLRLVASTLAAQARLTDHIARWGGEEFLAVLPGPLDGAVTFAERARRAIEALDVPKVGRITISVGVAEVGADETPKDAISRADERLYDAKKTGRNRVVSQPPAAVQS